MKKRLLFLYVLLLLPVVALAQLQPGRPIPSGYPCGGDLGGTMPDCTVTDDSHGHTGPTITGDLDNNARVCIRTNSGAQVGCRRQVNLIEGSNVTLSCVDDSGGEEVDCTVTSSGGGGSPLQCKTIGDPVTSYTDIFVFDFGPSAVTADYMSYLIGGGTSVTFTLKIHGGADLTTETATTTLVKNDTTFTVGTAITGAQVVDIDIDAVDDTAGAVPWVTVCLRAQ